MAEIGRFPPINSGVIIADAGMMALMMSLFNCEIVVCHGWDQAVFTRLVYMDLRRLAPVTILSPEFGRTLHLHSNLEASVSRTHEVINEQGEVAAVVHAYDRFERLAGIVAERFPFGGRNAGQQSLVFSRSA